MGFIKNDGKLGDSPEKLTRTAPPRICMPLGAISKKHVTGAAVITKEIFRAAAIVPSPRMAARERRLKDMADLVASANKDAAVTLRARTLAVTDPGGVSRK